MVDSLHEKHHSLDRRVTVVETHLEDHVAGCERQWLYSEQSRKELKRKVNWLFATVISGLGATIFLLVRIMYSGVPFK